MNLLHCPGQRFMLPSLPWLESFSVHHWSMLLLWSFPSSSITSWRQWPQAGINKWNTWKDHALSFMGRVNFFGFQSAWIKHSWRVLVASWASWIGCLDLWVGLAETECARPRAAKWCAHSLCAVTDVSGCREQITKARIILIVWMTEKCAPSSWWC